MRLGKWIFAVLLCLGAISAYAIPVLTWTDEANQRGFANLSPKLQNTLVDAPSPATAATPNQTLLAPSQALGAQVWEWEESRFKSAAEQPLTQLALGQRWVARAQLSLPASSPTAGLAPSLALGPDLYLLWPLQRLDYLHISYRVNQGAWLTVSAGDRIAMQNWPSKNPFPAFALPRVLGTIDVVVEAVHTGVISDKVLLSSRAEYRAQHFGFAMLYGLIVGLSIAIALCSFGMAFAFSRKRFAAVTVLSLCAAFAMLVTSGIAGMYLFTDSAQWNDESKMSVLLLLAAILPWGLTIVVGYAQRIYILWWVSNLWLALVLLAIAVGWLIELHGLRLEILIAVWVVSIGLVLAVGGAAALADDPRLTSIVATTVLGILSLLMYVLNYAGIGQSAITLGLGTCAMAMALLGMLYIMYLQYRQGRAVLTTSRANTGRDALTGLRDSSGFEHTLAVSTLRLVDNSSIAFYWIQLAPAQALRGHYGDEGYDHGLVRLAATLASCLDGQDSLGRVQDNCFCATVSMRHDPENARTIATKMLSRALAISQDSEAMTKYLRIAIAWMPSHGVTLQALSSRCRAALEQADSNKKIVFVQTL